MSVFSEDCPYCGTKSVAFTIHYEDSTGYKDGHKWHWNTFAKCGYCRHGIVAQFLTFSPETPPSSPDPEAGVELLRIYPSLPENGAPEHTPENVALFFKQAMDNLPKNWDAAGSMFRKALDTGLTSKFPEITGKLYDRIKEAEKQQKLTPELAAWAHQIRLDGNDAAHKEKPFEEEDAKNLCEFTRLVFYYLFTLPGWLEKFQNRTGE